MLLEKLAEFEHLRLTSPPLPPGAAPATSSVLFRTKGCESRSKAKRWDDKLSIEARLRQDSTLKASSRSLDASKIISLGTGRPASQFYPWESLVMNSLPANITGNNCSVAPSASTSCTKGETGYDLAVALNYGNATGSPQLLRFVTEHVELIHNPPYADWETSLTCSNTSALEAVIRMLCNRGDCILSEEYTYAPAVEAANPLGVKVLGIKMDEIGLIPEILDLTLRNWNSAAPRPTVLYTIPTGQNPTGVTQTTERRKAIYEIADQHGLIIVEDDPYYFLHLSEDQPIPVNGVNFATRQEEYLKRLPPSYLSMDVSGRVIRLDSTSKILAPGLRLGWITACSQLIEKFLNHTNFSIVAPSGPSQVMMYKLLEESWGHIGFLDWLMYLSSEYSRRLRKTVNACRIFLPDEICHWRVPKAGMFLWIQIDWSKHPSVHHAGHLDSTADFALDIEDRIYIRAKEKGVRVSKGSWFAADTRTRDYIYIRLTFAAASEDDLEKAVGRFADAVRGEFLPNEIIEMEQEQNHVAARDVAVAA